MILLISEVLRMKQSLSRCQQSIFIGGSTLGGIQAISLCRYNPTQKKINIRNMIIFVCLIFWRYQLFKGRKTILHMVCSFVLLSISPTAVQINRMYYKREVSLQKKVPQEK